MHGADAIGGGVNVVLKRDIHGQSSMRVAGNTIVVHGRSGTMMSREPMCDSQIQ
jgi:hypothetical protein